MKRNLIFHLFPRKTAPVWKWHLEKLLPYMPLFTGRRIVSVVMDGRCAEEPEIQAALAPLEAEIHWNPNSDLLCEVAHFIRTLGALESLDPQEATFYAHAKGVMREGGELRAVKRWSEVMYEFNLGRIDLVDRLLETHASVGCFRMLMPHAGSDWHYAGTFFWLKHSALFSRQWKDIDRNGRFGVEGYPGRHVPLQESATLTPDNLDPVRLYNGDATIPERVEAYRQALQRAGTA